MVTLTHPSFFKSLFTANSGYVYTSNQVKSHVKDQDHAHPDGDLNGHGGELDHKG